MFRPHQVVRVKGRWYQVVGVFLGAEGQTSLVGVVPLSEKPGCAYGKTEAEMLVPEVLLSALVKSGGAELYRPEETL